MVAEEAGRVDVAEYVKSIARSDSFLGNSVSDWLTANGGHIWGGWNSGTFATAAVDSRSDVLRFLYNAGCDIDEDLSASEYSTSDFLTRCNIPHKKITPPKPDCDCARRCVGECDELVLHAFGWVHKDEIDIMNMTFDTFLNDDY